VFLVHVQIPHCLRLGGSAKEALMMGSPIHIFCIRYVGILAVLGGLSACQQSVSPKQSADCCVTPAPAAKVKRHECLRIAEAYASFKWKPSQVNVLHGNDTKGIRVDTPDVAYKPEGGFAGWWHPETWNEGLPYKWGGFDTLETFEKGVAQGRPAGDAFTAQKRNMNDSAVSDYAVGVDCSGLVARCWRMPTSFSTYEIAKHCDRLPDYESLRPGDVVNKEHEHISIFVCWEDSAHEIMTVYDAGCPPNLRVVKHGTYTSYLKSKGYHAWRYRGMVD